MSDAPVERLEEQLGVLLRRARAISGQLARDLHPELEPGAYGLMNRVTSSPGGARATDLAAYLGIGKPTVSRQLATLERLGLVLRSPDPADARAQVVQLTPLGVERITRVKAVRQAHMSALLGSWRDEDVDQLATLVGRFNEVSEADRPAPSDAEAEAVVD